MGEGVWIDSDKLDINDEIRDVIKHGTLSVGFIGLAETLKALIGYHHGENEIAQNLGLDIVSHMRRRMDEYSEKYKMNFTLLATPAEGLSGRFVKIDKEKYGIIEGVTDRDYYTNSFHIPVYYPISAFKKIQLEAPYHALTNAGHISYIELDGDPTQNLDAFEKVVRYMKEQGIGYGSINHPVDRDPCCGFNGIIGDTCPKCGRSEAEGPHFQRIRRITGYLVDVYKRQIMPLDPTVSEITDIKTAVSEAVTNSIIHGYDGLSGDIVLFCSYEGREIHIEISDRGRGIADIKTAMTPLYTSRPELERSGLGFTVMETFMDSLKVESLPGEGTKVIMSKKLSDGE